jgi:hypothetical protein
MARNQPVRLNSAGIARLLKSPEFAAMVNDAAVRAAAGAGANAVVEPYSTDREAAAVVVPAEDQARDGVLTRGAAAAALEVKQKP